VGDNKFSAKGLTPVRGDRLRLRIILPSGEEFSSIFPSGKKAAAGAAFPLR
jgi:hypothetical protein